MKNIRAKPDPKPLNDEEQQEFERLKRLDRLSEKERKRIIILGTYEEIER